MKKLLIMFLLAGLTYGQALTGLAPSATYKDLLHISNSNLGLDATLRPVYDGAGNASALQISTTAVKFPTPFTLGAVSVTTTGTQLNYLSSSTGTTGTGNVVFSTSPVLVTPTLGVATATSLALSATGSVFTQLISSNKWTLQNDAASPASLVTIDSIGNVSIGSPITTQKLSIDGGTSIAAIQFHGLSAGTNEYIGTNGGSLYLSEGAYRTTPFIWANDAGADVSILSINRGSIIFYTDTAPATGFTPSERMRITNVGNGAVLIGYPSDPTSGNKLAVNGNGYFAGTGTFTGLLTSAGLTLSSGDFTGNALTRGTNAFTTTATADTVAITGASVNDIYVVSYITAVTAAESPLSVVSTATGFIVTRPIGTTSGAAYAYIREK